MEHNLTLDQFGRTDKSDTLQYRMSQCGRWIRTECFCKKCFDSSTPIKSVTKRHFCEIRYCSNPDCLVHRFKNQLELFKKIPEFHSYKKLWHFVIGFQSIPELEFKKNFSRYYKRYQYVLNRFFDKLRKKNINLQGIRVTDFSFKTEGMVFIHFHFAVIPLPNTYRLMRLVKSQMLSRMKIKTSFIIEPFKLASKNSIFSYFSIRSSGMYKYDMTKNPKYKHIQGKLRESITSEKYIFLRNVLTVEEYLNSFYGKPMYTTIGNLKRPPRFYGSNITEDIPCQCPIHGILSRNEVRYQHTFIDLIANVPPDNNYDDSLDITIVKI